MAPCPKSNRSNSQCFSIWFLGTETKNLVIWALRSGVMAFFQWKSKMKEPTKSAVPQSILLGKYILFFLTGYHAQGHDLYLFQKFPETTFTTKEWFLSKKELKEGERVAQGHFHERVGETPWHWLPPGARPTPIPCCVARNGPFENFLRSNLFFYSKFHGLF